MDELIAIGVETGAADPYTEAVKEGLKYAGQITDVFAGGPQKRERAARYERDAAQAMRDAALAELEAAKLAASVPVSGGGGVLAASVGGGGLLDKLRAPSPLGVPWWAVVAGGAVVVWWAVRR